MMRFLLPVVFSLVLSTMTAQSPVTFERYSTLQGLPQNSIFSIAQGFKFEVGFLQSFLCPLAFGDFLKTFDNPCHLAPAMSPSPNPRAPERLQASAINQNDVINVSR